jgi:hypothetical protein
VVFFGMGITCCRCTGALVIDAIPSVETASGVRVVMSLTIYRGSITPKKNSGYRRDQEDDRSWLGAQYFLTYSA